jgi:opacity protein-like surface antigen
MKSALFLAALLAAISSPAFADVKAASDTGFNSVHIATVNATPDEIWKRLLTPKDYWNKAHSWSGSSAGFYIDAQANGCFCELFQEPDVNGKLKTVGSVEHMRVIFAHPGKVLRMQGALGPLQSEAVIGTLTVAIEPSKDNAGTRVSFSYVVGGYMRYKVTEIAPAVDKVLGEQFKNMLSPFAPAGTEGPKVESFKLDTETIEEAASKEASKVSTAKPDEVAAASEPPRTEPN